MTDGREDRDPNKKAYDKGCMWGMSGRPLEECPFQDDNLASWWEAGWHEGNEAWRKRNSARQAS